MDGGQIESASSSLEEQKSTARSLADQGSTEDAVAAWRSILEQSPNDRQAHKALGALLMALGEYLEAAVHIRVVIERTPDNRAWWTALAKALQKGGDLHGAAEAWRKARALGEIKPLDLQSFAGLLKAIGASAELRELAAAEPMSIAVWTWIALDAAERKDWPEAEVAWDRVIELGGNVWAFDEQDRLRYRAARSRTDLRVTVIGNCQAFGIAESLRRLLPEADVASWVPGVCRGQDVDPFPFIDERLAKSDIVITQRPKGRKHLFDFDSVRRLSRNLFVVPQIAFTGFHPDMTRLAQQSWPVPAVFRPYHSAIIAGAWLRGVPKGQVADLFNAYIYARLGYFDEFERARTFLLNSAEDLDLSELFEIWRGGGTFVHIPVHPKIQVFHTLAKAVCQRLGIDYVETDAGPDHQADNMVWPVYPEVAKRLGVRGSFDFHPRRGLPWQGLEETVEHFYGLYSGVDSKIIASPEIQRVAEALRREGC